MDNKMFKVVSEFEGHSARLDEITSLLWDVYSQYLSKDPAKNNAVAKRLVTGWENYSKLLSLVHSLLGELQTGMDESIERAYGGAEESEKNGGAERIKGGESA